MIQDIFLTYANEPSRNNPKFFQSVFSAVSNNITINLTGVDEVLKYISEISVFNDVKSYLSYVNNAGSDETRYLYDPIYYATYATAGQRFYYYNRLDQFERNINQKTNKKKNRWIIDCDKKEFFNCGYRKHSKKDGRVDHCENAFVMKCYECFQLRFIDMLIQITQEKEFDDIEDFTDSLAIASELDVVRTDIVIIQKQEESIRDVLIEEKSYAVGYLEFLNGPLGENEQTFNSFVFALSTLSLSRFILKNDRRKLKRCSYCNKFFIAKDIKRKHCCYSSECQKLWERDKKRRQREIDIVRYS